MFNCPSCRTVKDEGRDTTGFLTTGSTDKSDACLYCRHGQAITIGKPLFPYTVIQYLGSCVSKRLVTLQLFVFSILYEDVFRNGPKAYSKKSSVNYNRLSLSRDMRLRFPIILGSNVPNFAKNIYR